MDLSPLFDNKYLIGSASGIGGIVATLCVQQILNKRGLFTYFVRHERVGISADDPKFGRVGVTLNDNPIPNLFLSTVELINQSLRDYENVVACVYTNDTALFTEMTQIVGTLNNLKWTESYENQVRVAADQQPSPTQRDLYFSRREYLIPVVNRGQIVRFQFLNAAKTQNPPTIWLSILHKGVRVQFRVPQQEILGVPRPMATLVGLIVSIILVGFVIAFVKPVWIAAVSSLICGLVVVFPGAAIIRAWRHLRNLYGG
jgi:hypothetical protein